MEDICRFLLILPLGFRRSFSWHIVCFLLNFSHRVLEENISKMTGLKDKRGLGRVLGFKLILLLGIILPCVNGRRLPQAPVRHSHDPHDRTHPFMATVPYVYNPHGSSMKVTVRSNHSSYVINTCLCREHA